MSKTKTRVLLNVLPKNLEEAIFLPNLSAITILQRQKVRDFIPTFDFLRKRGPQIKFQNPHLTFRRQLDPNYLTPVVQVADRKGQVVESFSSAQMTSAQIFEKVREIDRKCAPNSHSPPADN